MWTNNASSRLLFSWDATGIMLPSRGNKLVPSVVETISCKHKMANKTTMYISSLHRKTYTKKVLPFAEWLSVFLSVMFSESINHELSGEEKGICREVLVRLSMCFKHNSDNFIKMWNKHSGTRIAAIHYFTWCANTHQAIYFPFMCFIAICLHSNLSGSMHLMRTAEAASIWILTLHPSKSGTRHAKVWK